VPEQLIDIKELSRRLSISIGVLYNKVSHRQIPFFKIGESVRFDYEEVIRSLCHFPTPDGTAAPQKRP
jgi:excisionase family DNA binding protein